MIIELKNLNYYYLTIPENIERIEHIKSEFKHNNIIQINPIPYGNIHGDYSDRIKRYKSGATGFLRIIDIVSQTSNNGNFKPFAILEDDVKKYRDFPDKIELPDDSDICYIGLSKWGMTDNNECGVRNSVCYTDVDNNIMRVYNMLSAHGFIVTSIRGLTSLQKCLVEDYYLNRGWDMCLSQIQPYINAYALKEPLVYQFGELGGQEEATKLNYSELHNKILPEGWINNTNLSSITHG
tara:strand:+ start:3759 stop:4472 length:714 start_codon:yes stop_codon:yes gene_type:complete